MNFTEREQFEALAREWIGLWSAPLDRARFDALHADDFEDCSSAGRPTTKAAFLEALLRFERAFPDVRTTVTDLVVDGEARYSSPALATENFVHPAYRALAAETGSVEVPAKYTLCGTPFTAEAARLIRDGALAKVRGHAE